jgi:polyisoprenoid-binding protein YceI
MALMKSLSVLACGSLLIGTPLAVCAAASCYTIDAGGSTLGFVAEQTGATFEGSFRRFEARISFRPADLAASRFDVMVEPASVDTGEEQRDTTLRGPDFFDVARFKTAHFVTTSFRKTGDAKYEATGKLTLRDVTHDVTIAFSFTTRKEGAADVSYLAGTASLKRLDFGVGRGEYEDTEAIGNDVGIKFKLRLLPAVRPPEKRIPTPPLPPQAE